MFLALLVALQAPAASEVLSPNGRYVAVLAPRAGETGPSARADLVVHELRAGGERTKVWSGVVPAERARPARAEFLTDDGAAFVRIDAEPGEGVAVREVLKGTNAAALTLSDLAAEADERGRWIDLAHGLRWRPSEAGLNARWTLDLLGTDGVVRTLDLDGGALEVKVDRTKTLDLLVHPPVPEPVLPATQETFVDAWELPRLAWAAATIEIEGHGHDPSANWRFIGFQVQGNPFETRKLVLTPRGVPPQGASAQIVKPHLWTARVNGLSPGVFHVEVCGKETPAGDARRDPAQLDPAGRTIEILTPHLVASLQTSPGNGIALYDDGRLELDHAGKRVLRLASPADEARLRGRVAALAALAEGRPRPPTRAEAERVGALTWRAKEAPARVLLDAELAPGARGLADDLAQLREDLDPAHAPRAYALDAAKSTLVIKTGSAGLFSAFGHDHDLAPDRFTGRFDVDARDVFRSRFTFSIEAASIHVKDRDSKEDAKEIEKNMNDGVIESARFPRIEFTSTALAPRKGEPGQREFAAIAGKPIEVVLTGELLLHGTKRTVRVPGLLELGADGLRVKGEFSIKHSEYGMKPFSAVGGAVKVDDKLKIVYDFTATAAR